MNATSKGTGGGGGGGAAAESGGFSGLGGSLLLSGGGNPGPFHRGAHQHNMLLCRMLLANTTPGHHQGPQAQPQALPPEHKEQPKPKEQQQQQQPKNNMTKLRSGRWSEEEHDRFLLGLRKHGRHNWPGVAAVGE